MRSIVSTFFLRTETDSPIDSLTSHEASLAPSERACCRGIVRELAQAFVGEGKWGHVAGYDN